MRLKNDEIVKAMEILESFGCDAHVPESLRIVRNTYEKIKKDIQEIKQEMRQVEIDLRRLTEIHDQYQTSSAGAEESRQTCLYMALQFSNELAEKAKDETNEEDQKDESLDA